MRDGRRRERIRDAAAGKKNSLHARLWSGMKNTMTRAQILQGALATLHQSTHKVWRGRSAFGGGPSTDFHVLKEKRKKELQSLFPGRGAARDTKKTQRTLTSCARWMSACQQPRPGEGDGRERKDGRLLPQQGWWWVVVVVGGWWWWWVGSGGWWWPPASHPAPTHPCSRSGQSTQHDKTGRHCAPSPCPTPMGGGGEPTMHKEMAKNPGAKK
jgi:hypothetical protein